MILNISPLFNLDERKHLYKTLNVNEKTIKSANQKSLFLYYPL